MTVIHTPTATRRPRGFTLPELLVTLALILFMMVILTEAFSAGTGVFRTLKAQGDLQEKLRAAETLIRDDLVQPHFDANQKLSNLDSNLNLIRGGYFSILQPGVSLNPPAQPLLYSGTQPEGNLTDSFGVASDVPLHLYNVYNPLPPVYAGYGPPPPPALCFTVRHPGNQPQDYFIGRIAGAAQGPAALKTQGPVDYRQSSAVISRWTEVGYFLWPNGNTANGTPLYTLRRRIRVVPENVRLIEQRQINTLPANRLPTSTWAHRFAEVSCLPDPNTPGVLYFNTPADLLTSTNQVMPQSLVPLRTALQASDLTFLGSYSNWGLTPQSLPFNATAGPQGDPSWVGDDLVIPDVIMFNVQALSPALASFPDFGDVNGVYNTGTANGTPNTTQVFAIRITIRVWDLKTQLTRQLTIVQDM